MISAILFTILVLSNSSTVTTSSDTNICPLGETERGLCYDVCTNNNWDYDTSKTIQDSFINNTEGLALYPWLTGIMECDFDEVYGINDTSPVTNISYAGLWVVIIFVIATIILYVVTNKHNE